MRLSSLAVLLAASAVAVACSLPSENGPGDERTGASRQAIQGGAVESGLPNVGLLEFSTGNFGTATLITPRVVLTAGHVVGGNIQGFYTGAGKPIHRGPDFSTSSAMTKHAVAEKLTHPSYECKTDCAKYPVSLDVGLVLLDGPAPEYVPIPIGDGPRGSLVVGMACSTTGYGNHVVDFAAADAAPQVKEKRSAGVKLLSMDPSLLEVEWVTGIADHGDSGGPLFCGGALVGTTAYHLDGDGAEHRVEWYQRTEAALPWIREQLRAWGDTTLELPPDAGGDASPPAETGADATTAPDASPAGAEATASGCAASGHAASGTDVEKIAAFGGIGVVVTRLVRRRRR